MSDIERALRAAHEERQAQRRERRAARKSSVPTESPSADARDVRSSRPAAASRPSSELSSESRTRSGLEQTSGKKAGEPHRLPVHDVFGHDSARPRSQPERVIDLPFEHLARQGFITPNLAKGRLSEEYRRVKRPILRAITDGVSGDGHPNIVAVTSSVAGEGKTYTAINLAMSLAMERDRTVLLLDADVLKGTAGRTLGVESDSPGLTDVLSDDEADLADVILGTDLPNLRLVPAGRSTDRATELLSSVRMRELVGELAVRYADRIVVLDCPPILQTNEASVIVEHAGQVVFVVAAEETDRRSVFEALNQFDERSSVSVLLNKTRARGASYYDYGYAHG